MRNPSVSVIVPAYNCEKTIVRALDSIANQTYLGQIDLIVINDGSIDGTPEILNDYQVMPFGRKYMLIHQKNGGVSAARNKGIEISVSDYIAFLDSDDYYHPEAFRNYMNKVEETDCDLLFGNIEQKVGDKEITGSEKAMEFQPLFKTGVINSPCAKVYKREWLVEAGIKFAPDLSIGEDLLFNTQAYFKAQHVLVMSYIGYVYDHSASSLTESYPPRYFEQRLLLLERFREMLLKEGQLFEDEGWFYTKLCYSVILKYLASGKHSFAEKSAFIKQVRQHPQVRDKIVSTKPKGLVKQVVTSVIVHTPISLLVHGLELLPIIKKILPRGATGTSI